MSKQIPAFPYLALSACLLVGCGNKGELFLPPDAAIARELEAVNERTDDSSDESTDDEVTRKEKRLQGKAPDTPPQ
ncbi:MAG: hypothetical protein AB8B97_13565 [Granulosicoccus sp.]